MEHTQTKNLEHNVLQEKRKLLLAQHDCIISIVRLLENDEHVPEELLINLQDIQDMLPKYKITDKNNIHDIKEIIRLSVTNNEIMVVMLEKIAHKNK